MHRKFVSKEHLVKPAALRGRAADRTDAELPEGKAGSVPEFEAPSREEAHTDSADADHLEKASIKAAGVERKKSPAGEWSGNWGTATGGKNGRSWTRGRGVGP